MKELAKSYHGPKPSASNFVFKLVDFPLSFALGLFHVIVPLSLADIPCDNLRLAIIKSSNAQSLKGRSMIFVQGTSKFVRLPPSVGFTYVLKPRIKYTYSVKKKKTKE